MFDIYTIIFLALAVFIFLRLRSVLGQRTGRERPPYDPYSARDAVRGATNDNVVTLPGRGGEPVQKPADTPEPAERLKGIAEAGTIASPPAVINAVIDAVSHLGVTEMGKPASPERVWRAIQEGKGGTT